MENNISVWGGGRNGIYFVTFTDRSIGLSCGVMSKNPDKIREWKEKHGIKLGLERKRLTK